MVNLDQLFQIKSINGGQYLPGFPECDRISRCAKIVPNCLEKI